MSAKRFKPKSVCIFDFDGTLVDSMEGFADLAAGLMEKNYGLSYAQAREKYLKTSGLPFFQQLESLFPNNPLNGKVAQDFEVQKKRYYFERPFFQEVYQTIERLRRQGVRVVVSSNNGQDVIEEYLDHQDAPPFDLVLGFKEGFSKGRAHFEKVLDHFDLSVDEAVFVGDSLYDAQKALDFGVDFVGRVGTFSHHKFKESYPEIPTVKNLHELIDLICK